MSAALPKTSLIRQLDTHRLILSKYSANGESVLSQIAEDDRQLADLFDLDHATNDRLSAENGLLPGIARHELVFGVPYFRIVNAAFTHAHPLGSRFNGPYRGAWYGAFELETALAEIVFHKTIEYAEIGRFEDAVGYDEYLADFSAELHDLRDEPAWVNCLSPDSYIASQGLSERLLEAGSLGVVYSSVRRAGGTCLCCFRPTLVMNVRRGTRFRLSWSGEPEPRIEIV